MEESDQIRQKKINVPTQYRQGAKILKQMVEEGKSLKNLVYNNQHLVSFFLSLQGVNYLTNRTVLFWIAES